ncbi:MAG: GAF domain-containing protein, partial [Oryzomonas sp.]
MRKQLNARKRSTSLGLAGFLLGFCAPVGWIIIRTLLFYDSGKSVLDQILNDILASPEHLVLYNYMGFGTAIVLAGLGYLIGRNDDELHERAAELDTLHKEVASQKEIFENRYKVLDNNIKNFHQITSKMQMSLDLDEILRLCAAGLHEVLGYERVNILMVRNSTQLRFVTTAGTDNYDVAGVTMPLDGRIGVIHKCLAEKKVFLIDDISNYPDEYHLQPPYNSLKPLRSRSFILCPIVVKGEAVGVFGIDNKSSRRPLNDSDVDTIMLFADQVASAITTINLMTSINTLTTEMENSFAFLLSSRGQHFNNIRDLKESVESVAGGTAAIASAAEGVMASVDETSAA